MCSDVTLIHLHSKTHSIASIARHNTLPSDFISTILKYTEPEEDFVIMEDLQGYCGKDIDLLAVMIASERDGRLTEIDEEVRLLTEEEVEGLYTMERRVFSHSFGIEEWRVPHLRRLYDRHSNS